MQVFLFHAKKAVFHIETRIGMSVVITLPHSGLDSYKLFQWLNQCSVSSCTAGNGKHFLSTCSEFATWKLNNRCSGTA